MIKTLLWDLDGTILDFGAAEYNALKALFLEFGFGEIRGCIDSTTVGIKLDSDEDELKHRLTELKDDIVVECKAISDITGNHRAQLFNYMRLLKKQCGILVNFYPFSADVERYFYDKETNQIIATDGHVIYDYNRR